MRLKKYLSFSLLSLFAMLNACTSFGPHNINADRSHYNDIIWQTDLEQLLKNIVRLRYIESSSYFQVTNVTASYSLVRGLSGTGVTPASSLGYYPTWSGSPNLIYSDSPTISYAPLGNAAFVASLEKPIDFNYFLLLTHGCHYDFDVLGKIMLTQIGPLTNSPSAVSMSVYETPNYQPYYRFVDGIERLIISNEITPKPIYFSQSLGILLQFKHKNSAEALSLKKMVGVPANSENIIIMPEGEAVIVEEQNGALVIPKLPNKLSNVVYAQTRSIEAILTFLAHGVQVPQSDLDGHFTMEGHNADNTLFNWSPMMNGIITIYSSDVEPIEDVMIKTHMNGHWFYIKASDTQSKTTLYLIIKLIDIVSVLPPQYQGPSLTLPG